MTSILRRLRSEERGLTLVELSLTVALLFLVTGAFLTFLDSMNRAVITETGRSRANDQARLAIDQLDREVRSANYIYDPQLEANPYKNLQLRIYTQANVPTRGGLPHCVQYRVQDGNLLRRSWAPTDPASLTAWRTVAEHIVNAHPSVDEAAFHMDPTVARGGRTVEVNFYVDVDPDDDVSRPTLLETDLTGRNVPSGFTSAVCEPVPAG